MADDKDTTTGSGEVAFTEDAPAKKPEPTKDAYEPTKPEPPLVVSTHDRDSEPIPGTPAGVYAPEAPLAKDKK